MHARLDPQTTARQAKQTLDGYRAEANRRRALTGGRRAGRAEARFAIVVEILRRRPWLRVRLLRGTTAWGPGRAPRAVN